MPDSSTDFDILVGGTVNIYSSREIVRNQLTEFAQNYLELQSVDLYKTSFLSYVIDILSILTANQMFYTSSIYREFFLVTSQFRESVLNLSRWIGYNPEGAIPSRVDVLFRMPLTFGSPSVTFAIPSDFQVFAGEIPFTIDSNPATETAATFQRHVDPEDPTESKSISSTPVAGANVQIINNNAITVIDSNGYSRPVGVSDDERVVSFVLPFSQTVKIVKQFLIPSDLEFYQFFSRKIEFDGMYSDLEVYVREPGAGETLTIEDEEKYIISSNEEDFATPEFQAHGYRVEDLWEPSEAGLYTLSPTDKEYVWTAIDDEGELFFGNGVLGRQPAPGSKVLVLLNVTQGEGGQIVPGGITTGDILYYLVPDEQGLTSAASKIHRISYEVVNAAPSTGGVNAPSLPEIKHNAIVNLRAKKRLVSDLDYDDINEVMGPEFPVIESQPILKRSDIKVNEIMAFMRLIFHDEQSLPEIVPTRNGQIEVIEPVFAAGKYTIPRKTTTTIGGAQYETLFNMVINQATRTASYDYILTYLYDTPAALSATQPFFESQEYIAKSYIPMTTADFVVDTTPVIVEDSSSSSGSTPQAVYPLHITANLNHIPTSEVTEFAMKIITKWGDNDEYTMANGVIADVEDYDLGGGVIVPKYNSFSLTIPDYTTVPEGIQRIEYTVLGKVINNEGIEEFVELQRYFTDVIIRQDLSDKMLSIVTTTREWDGICHDDTMWIVHNVPLFLSPYLDDGEGGGVYNTESQRNFELVVIQNLLNSLDMKDKRMLTDFINVKFPDTHGTFMNLKYNHPEYTVLSRYNTPFADTTPGGSSSSIPREDPGDKYIVNGPVPGIDEDLSEYMGFIADKQDDDSWLIIPTTRDIYVKVLDEYDEYHLNSILAFTGNDWIDVQSFTIPFEIYAKIRMGANASSSEAGLIAKVKEELMEHFTPKFGMDRPLDRSEIISIIRSVDFVTYCELVKPEIDIRLNYNIKDLTQQELLDYTPQYVGFTEDSITIEIL